MSELTSILTETTNRLLQFYVTREQQHLCVAGEWPKELWHALEENGLTQPLVSETQGGVGAMWQDAFIIAFASGRWQVPAPLVETIVASWLLSQAGIEIPTGPITLIDDGHKLEMSGINISGTAHAVPWGRHASHAVAIINSSPQLHVALIPTSKINYTSDLSMAREPRDHLDVVNVSAQLFPLTDGVDISSIRLAGALMRSAQISGAMQAAIKMTVSYATDREQFGRPIAKFQAIQQILAVAASKSVEACVAAEVAFRTADLTGGDFNKAEFDIASAKIVCSEAVETITDMSHQVHGAIGFTQEHDLHFITQRLWTWRAEFGSETFWAERLGRKVLKRGAKNLWPDMIDRQSLVSDS